MNLTFDLTGKLAVVTGGGGIDVFNSPGTVRNCIVYGCENDAGPANSKSGKGIVVEYTATAPLFDGTGNILLATMPKFADVAGGDYSVTAGATEAATIASDGKTLTVALKPMAKPGPFRKKVTLYRTGQTD